MNKTYSLFNSCRSELSLNVRTWNIFTSQSYFILIIHISWRGICIYIINNMFTLAIKNSWSFSVHGQDTSEGRLANKPNTEPEHRVWGFWCTTWLLCNSLLVRYSKVAVVDNTRLYSKACYYRLRYAVVRGFCFLVYGRTVGVTTYPASFIELHVCVCVWSNLWYWTLRGICCVFWRGYEPIRYTICLWENIWPVKLLESLNTVGVLMPVRWYCSRAQM